MAGENCATFFLVAMATSVFCWDSFSEELPVSREERSLVFGKSGQIQVTAGFDLPAMVNNVTVTVSLSAQATYSLPTNASEFSYPYTSSSRGRTEHSPWAVTRWQVYSYLEQALSGHGFSGHACLLRSVCDAARIPFHTAGRGLLLEQILHIVLTYLALWLPLLLRANTITRVPRSLVFYDGGTYKFVIGLAVPVEFRKRFLSWSYNFQFQYTLPDNITEFTTVSSSRTLRDAQRYFNMNVTNTTSNLRAAEEDIIHRGVIYDSLENKLNRTGVSGHACMLRSLCEAAETPLYHSGLIGELLHALLTPDFGSSSTDFLHEDYITAHRMGKTKNVDCDILYPDCPRGFGLLDLFTAVSHI